MYTSVKDGRSCHSFLHSFIWNMSFSTNCSPYLNTKGYLVIKLVSVTQCIPWICMNFIVIMCFVLNGSIRFNLIRHDNFIGNGSNGIILLVTPCLLTRLRVFIHTQHRNTTRDRRRKQTRGNEFIPCSNNICDIRKGLHSFKIPTITLIWPESPYKYSVTKSYRSGNKSGRRSESPLWRHQRRSFVFISHADDVKCEIRLHIPRLLTNQKRESARSMG